MTLLGCIVFLVLMATGHKPKKYGYTYYIEVGENWGGLELGAFFIGNRGISKYTKNHETGHTLQNCYLGFAMPFVVSLPSAARYWLRNMSDMKRKRIYAGVLFAICLMVSAAFAVSGALFGLIGLIIAGAFIAAYSAIIFVWLMFIEAPQYTKYVSYDAAWFEGDATRRGTEFINSKFPEL